MIRKIPIAGSTFALAVLVLSLPSAWWYGVRMMDGSDEPFGILALVAWGFFLPWKQFGEDLRREMLPNGWESVLWIGVGVGILAVPNLPALARAGALVGLISFSGLWRGMPKGAVVLGFLSLPILASLDFYLGFPLRWTCGWIGTELLQLAGLPVSLQGISMKVGGQEIVIDRPCAGLKYLWFGWFVSGVLSASLRMNGKKVLIGSLFTGAILFLANVLRVTLLFLLEWKGWGGTLSHETTGLAVFSVALLAIVLVLHRLGRRGAVQKIVKVRPRSEGVRSVWMGSPMVFTPLLLCVALLACVGWVRDLGGDPVKASASVKNVSFRESQDLGEMALMEVFVEAGIPARLFRAEDSLVLVREVSRPTRRLHSAEDCFRGAGWKIQTATLWKDPYERNWRRFYARKGGVDLEVRQRIEGSDGWSGTDVSQWFWNATAGKTSGPWNAWVIVRERNRDA